tara:strand:- start:3273 stop:3875 length:603 start_codon:yes stop_codon:yes gene_type:complete
MLNKSNFVVRRRRSDSYYSTAETVLILYVTTHRIQYVEFKNPLDCHALLMSYCKDVSPEFLHVLVTKYCEVQDPRTLGFFLSVLVALDVDLFKKCFLECVGDSAETLVSFVLTLRSGVTGRKSLGSAPKRLVKQWLENLSDEDLFVAATGSVPGLVDVIRLVHPKPQTPQREALFAYLIGSNRCDFNKLPVCVKKLLDLT